jgi:hypothetical protein
MIDWPRDPVPWHCQAANYFDSGAFLADLTRQVAFRTESQPGTPGPVLLDVGQDRFQLATIAQSGLKWGMILLCGTSIYSRSLPGWQSWRSCFTSLGCSSLSLS